MILLAKLSSCNYSFRSVNDVGDTFRAMFPDSKIASTFSMSRSRASYIIGEGLGSHFTQVIYEIRNYNINFVCLLLLCKLCCHPFNLVYASKR